METKDILSLTLSTFAFVISVSNFVAPKYQDWKTGRGSIPKALHGDREAIEYIAYNVKNRRWIRRFGRKKTRKDIIAALCLGWSLELPDRTRAIIYDTLINIRHEKFKKEIVKAFEDILRQFYQFQTSFPSTNYIEKVEDIKKIMKELQPIGS